MQRARQRGGWAIGLGIWLRIGRPGLLGRRLPLRQQLDQAMQLLGQAGHVQRAACGIGRRRQGAAALRVGPVALEFGLGHIQQIVLAEQPGLHAHCQRAAQQLRKGGLLAQPVAHVGVGHAGAAQRDALAVGLLHGAVELAGHGQQPRLGMAQRARLALKPHIAAVAADQRRQRLPGALDQGQRARKARLGLTQPRLGAAGNGIGKLIVQARQLGMQVLELRGIGQAQGLRAGHLGQQAGQVIVLASGLRQRRQQAVHLPRQIGQGVVLLGGIPNQQAGLAQALEHVLQRLRLQGVKQQVQIIARYTPLGRAGQFQKAPQAQLHHVARPGKQAAQRIQQFQPLPQRPGQGRFGGQRWGAEIRLEAAAVFVVIQ